MNRLDVGASRRGDCPVCSAEILGGIEVEEADVLTCPDCRSALVVESLGQERLALGKAPQPEEDWGE